MRLSGCGADTTFSTFTGHDSTLLLSSLGRASFQRCSFRDFELSEGIFDVSDGSSVRLENCTFTNITVPKMTTSPRHKMTGKSWQEDRFQLRIIMRTIHTRCSMCSGREQMTAGSQRKVCPF
jgi:hypothetical protein